MLLALAALGIALIVAGLSARVYKSQRDHARANLEQAKAEFAGFVAAVKTRGEEQEAETARITKTHQEALRDAKTRFAADLARRDADLRRLRERPPADPGGREVPVLACGPPGADGTAAQLVSLAEYRAIEERAYDDALRLTRLQEWVRATGHPVE